MVDQFEEIFTACRDEAEQQRFITAICALAGPAVVVAALRADFYDHALRYPELARALQEHQVVVGPTTRDEVRSTIGRGRPAWPGSPWRTAWPGCATGPARAASPAQVLDRLVAERLIPVDADGQDRPRGPAHRLAAAGAPGPTPAARGCGHGGGGAGSPRR